MKVTKYEHSCLVVEEQGKRLVIDPGVYATSLPKLDNVCGIVVTHVHADHFSLEHIDRLQADNPEAVVYTVEEVAKELGERKHEIVKASVSDLCGVFHLSFFGGQHSIIHESLPIWQNVGVLINDSLYHPGDSFVLPEGRQIDALSVPAVAPWMKISEAMDFITAVKAKKVFPTHNAILSEIGEQIYYGRLQSTTETAGGTFHHLKPGESLEI